VRGWRSEIVKFRGQMRKETRNQKRKKKEEKREEEKKKATARR
jgi:hypothetical protein